MHPYLIICNLKGVIMQVNNISSQNFGMALKIKPEALSTLKNASRKEIEKLTKIGEELADTKYYHLEIGENGKRTIVSSWASKYEGGISVNNPYDEFLHFNAIWAGRESGKLKPGDKYDSVIKFANKEAAQSAYADIKSAPYGVERDAKIVKYLDRRSIEKESAEADDRNERKVVEGMVDNLFEKYGTKE